MPVPRQFWILALCGTVLVAVLAGGYLRWRFPPVEGFSVRAEPAATFTSLDAQLQRTFATAPAEDLPARYRQLFGYLVAGFLAYRSDSGARAHYPGWPSTHGRAVDGLEGFARIAPLLAAWQSGGRGSSVRLPDGEQVDLQTILARGLSAGTDPAHPAYWGAITAGDQRLVEAADIALALWLLRDSLWPALPEAVRANTVAWLRQAEGKADGTRFSNYRLFPLLVNRALAGLGVTVSAAAFERDWTALWAAHQGEGWFERNPSEPGSYDYYHAWAYHYGLYWLERMDPAGTGEQVKAAREPFVAFYQHLMTPAGFPVMGRSICYRMAAPAPLVAAALAGSDHISAGLAQRAFDSSWRYFVARGAVAGGAIVQGYCGADRRILDRYSGPASCLWATRALVLALSVPDAADFWQADAEPLPVELGDFEELAQPARWRVSGDQASGVVTLHQLDQKGAARVQPLKWRHRLAMKLLQRPFGPGNRAAKYFRARYASEPAFCGCRQPGGGA